MRGSIVQKREFGPRVTGPARRSSGRIQDGRRRSTPGTSRRRSRGDRPAGSSAARRVPSPAASRRLSTEPPILRSTSRPGRCQSGGRLRSPGRSFFGRRGHFLRSPPVAFRSPATASGRRGRFGRQQSRSKRPFDRPSGHRVTVTPAVARFPACRSSMSEAASSGRSACRQTAGRRSGGLGAGANLYGSGHVQPQTRWRALDQVVGRFGHRGVPQP